MTHPSIRDFCRYAMEIEEGRPITDPVRLGEIFRDYARLDRTPSITRSISLVRGLGVDIKAADYLDTGGINMAAAGSWHIHYSAKDKPGTQKFDIFHELFEVIQKTFTEAYPIISLLKEPQLSQQADRFAASVLLPPRFFASKANASGLDLVKLGNELELSHQSLLIALGRHFADLPFVGAVYERQGTYNGEAAKPEDFLATIVVKTGRAQRIRDLCWIQAVPKRKSRAQSCSLVCATITSGHSAIWRSSLAEDAPVVLVRPLLSAHGKAYRVILLAVPREESGILAAQIDEIDPVAVSGDTSCPSKGACKTDICLWKTAPENYE